MAFFLIPRRTVAAPAGRRSRGSSRKGDVEWAGLVGAGGVLLAALAQSDQAAGGAIAAAIVTGGPFVAWLGNGHRSRRGHEPVVVSKDGRGMGGGDVKLAALLGAIAGMPGVLAVLTVAVFGGTCAAVALMIMRRGGSPIPYGPFLAAGAVLAIV